MGLLRWLWTYPFTSETFTVKHAPRNRRTGATQVEWMLALGIIAVIGLLCAGCASWKNVISWIPDIYSE